MNITAISLVSFSFLISSPAFVANHWSISDCKFNHFSYILFYNQKSLLIKNSIFTNGLGSIIKKEQDPGFNNQNFTNDPNFCITDPITINNCRFENISCNSTILFNSSGQFEILDSSFYSCSSLNGVIYAGAGEILKITNSFSCESYGKEISAFLYKSGKVQELYLGNNLITQSYCTNNDPANIYSDGQIHNYENNNITDCDIFGIKIIDGTNLNFMKNIINIRSTCFYLAGAESKVTLKSVSFLNGNCDYESCIIFSSSNSYTLNIEDSLLASANNIIVGISSGSNHKYNLNLTNCYIQGNADNGILSTKDCTNTVYFDACSTKKFSQSAIFTKSNHFTKSNSFTKSNPFTQTNFFSPSEKFTISSVFSNSDIFSQSNLLLSKPDVPEAGNQNNNNKSGNNGTVIGVVVGVVAAVAIAAVVTVVVIKKKRSVQYTSDIEVINETNAVTVDNDLQDVMNDDDPFAEEFRS